MARRCVKGKGQAGFWTLNRLERGQGDAVPNH